MTPRICWCVGSVNWEAAPHETLSDREYQVLRLLGSGKTISDIGRDLGLSVKTISTYRARVLDKLGMRTNAELMRYAIENSCWNRSARRSGVPSDCPGSTVSQEPPHHPHFGHPQRERNPEKHRRRTAPSTAMRGRRSDAARGSRELDSPTPPRRRAAAHPQPRDEARRRARSRPMRD